MSLAFFFFLTCVGAEPTNICLCGGNLMSVLFCSMNMEIYFQRFLNLRPSLHPQITAYWVLHTFVLTFVHDTGLWLSLCAYLTGFGVAPL